MPKPEIHKTALLSLRLTPALLKQVEAVRARFRDQFTRADIIRFAIEEGLPHVQARVVRDLQKLQSSLEAEIKRRRAKP